MRSFLLVLFGLLHTASAIGQTPKMVYDAWLGNMPSFGVTGNLVSYNGRLYYPGSISSHGLELWRYDGVSAPTDIDYAQNATSGLGAFPYLTPFKGKLYMSAGKQATGPELTSFDGMSFSLILDIVPGLLSSRPRYFTELQGAGLLFFTADSPSTSSGGLHSELYCYDGINPPRRIRVNDGSNSGGSQPVYMQSLGNYLYFSAMPSAPLEYKLFRSDIAGAVTLAKGATRLINPGEKLLVGSKIYFSAYEPATGNEFYSYDGDTAIRITDIASGPLNGAYYEGTSLGGLYMRNKPTLYNGSIYFIGSADGVNYQLYAYNPATNNTTLVHTINPGGDGKVSNFYVYKNLLYFTAYTPAAGTEIWTYDGVTCALYADVWPGPKSGMAYKYSSTTPEQNTYVAFTEFKGDLYFKAQDSLHGLELWRIQAPVTTGVQRASFNGRVSVYPNPATSAVTLAITMKESRKLKIVVSDIAGKQVFSTSPKLYHSGEEQVSIPMQEFSNGQYVYYVKDEAGGAVSSGVLTKQ